MKHTIPCEVCGGTGKRPLHDSLLQTLTMLPRKGFAVANQLTVPGVGANGINNRLERLRDFGFVKRERFGKYWRYSRA